MMRSFRCRSAALGARLAALLCLATVASPALAGGAPRVHDASVAARAGEAELTVPPPPPEYQIEDLGWIEFAYHPSTRDRVRPLIARADALRAELRALLGREVLAAPVKVRIADIPAELDHLVPGRIEGRATAVSFGALRLAVLSATPRLGHPSPDLERAFRHQLAHLALDEATGGAALPRWFHEGFAIHAAGERAVLRAQKLSVAALRSSLVPLVALEAHLADAEETTTSIAGAQAADIVRFLLDGDRKASFARALAELRAGAPFSAAIEAAYSSTSAELELAWRADVARRYGFVPVLAGALLVVGLFVGGGLALQRLRARRSPPLPAPRRRPRAASELRARPPRASTAQLVATLGARQRAEGDSDTGIPKVEHNGKWHTLH